MNIRFTTVSYSQKKKVIEELSALNGRRMAGKAFQNGQALAGNFFKKSEKAEK